MSSGLEAERIITIPFPFIQIFTKKDGNFECKEKYFCNFWPILSFSIHNSKFLHILSGDPQFKAVSQMCYKASLVRQNFKRFFHIMSPLAHICTRCEYRSYIETFLLYHKFTLTENLATTLQ